MKWKYGDENEEDHFKILGVFRFEEENHTFYLKLNVWVYQPKEGSPNF